MGALKPHRSAADLDGPSAESFGSVVAFGLVIHRESDKPCVAPWLSEVSAGAPPPAAAIGGCGAADYDAEPR
jgi:hypothetical protein